MIYLSIKIYFYVLYYLSITLFHGSYDSQALVEKEVLTDHQKHELTQIFVEDNVNEFNQVLKESFDRYHFNGHILVVHHGRIIFNNFIGYADFNTKDTLSSESVYQLASVSKQFTAMAIMILKERGILDYDDRMVQFIPELSGEKIPDYDSITIRHLLNHTAGLPNYMYFVEKYKNKNEYPYNDEVVRLLADYKMHLNFKPGTRFSYSNTGYILLALIAERVSQQPFGEFIKDNIFIPLNMHHSFVYSRTMNKNETINRLVGYKKYRKFYPIPETRHDGVVGDKGVYSTASDLYKWDRALYSDILVSNETLEEAFTPGKLKNGRDIPYGFGFRIKQHNLNGRMVYHNGLWNGFRTSFYRYTENNSAIIIMDHTDCKAKHIIAKKIEKILLSHHLNYTQLLAEKAIEDGPEKAIDIYYTMNKMKIDFIVNIEELKKIYQYLNEIDKKQIASRIDLLLQAISGQVDS